MSRQPGSTSPRAEQRQALLELHGAISRVDWMTPCSNSLLWISDADEDQVQAAEQCAGCPVIIACRNYIHQYPREQGVYAGTTYAQRQSKGRNQE